MNIATVTAKPTKDMPEGLYRVVNAQGIYWGTFKVATNWMGERFVMEAWGDELIASNRNLVR